MKRTSLQLRLARLVLACVLLVLHVLPADAVIQLGSVTLQNPPAMKLDGVNPFLAQPNRNGIAAAPAMAPPGMNINDAVQSLAFLGQVGGVAFGSEAKGADGGKIISISYETNQPDGDRLVLILRTKDGRNVTAHGRFADWLIVPAAHLAAQDNISCVTLFGTLRDPVADRACRDAGQTIINYNSALEGTLLGLRLMQSDLMLLDPTLAVELPRTGTGVLLGLGEAQPNIEANRRRAMEMNQFISELSGGPFQSYLICDYGQEITFAAENGSLVLSGWPYWYCWRYKTQDPSAFAAIQKKANLQAQQDMQRETRPGGAGDGAGLQSKYDALFDQNVSRALLAAMPDYSVAVSAKMKYTEGGNPVVYQALTSAMRLTAVFRNARHECPEQWRHFLDALPVKGIYFPEWVATVIPAPNITSSQSTDTPNAKH
jgi:hypothetical protein